MLANLNSLNAHNLPILQPILMILISKFMVHRTLSDKTYLSLGLLSPLKQFFINVSYHILVASLTLMALFKTSALDWLQVYDDKLMKSCFKDWSQSNITLASNKWVVAQIMQESVRYGILGQVWCLIVLIPDLCPLSYNDTSQIHQLKVLNFSTNYFLQCILDNSKWNGRFHSV